MPRRTFQILWLQSGDKVGLGSTTQPPAGREFDRLQTCNKTSIGESNHLKNIADSLHVLPSPWISIKAVP